MAAPRALIVDDDLEVLQVLAEFVKREGFVASVASTIGQAREEIANPPDILLVDIQLPTAAASISSTASTLPPTQVVLITGTRAWRPPWTLAVASRTTSPNPWISPASRWPWQTWPAPWR
jgi:DNA-binding NtrC family response regulator